MHVLQLAEPVLDWYVLAEHEKQLLAVEEGW